MTKLKELRINKGLTQLDLAKIAGIYPSTILNYESGIRLPDVEVAQKIASALGVRVEEIWPSEKVA